MQSQILDQDVMALERGVYTINNFGNISLIFLAEMTPSPCSPFFIRLLFITTCSSWRWKKACQEFILCGKSWMKHKMPRSFIGGHAETEVKNVSKQRKLITLFVKSRTDMFGSVEPALTNKALLCWPYLLVYQSRKQNFAFLLLWHTKFNKKIAGWMVIYYAGTLLWCLL